MRLTLGRTLRLDTNTNIDMLITVLDHGHGYSNGFDSTEFVLFTHSQRISVVTKD